MNKGGSGCSIDEKATMQPAVPVRNGAAAAAASLPCGITDSGANKETASALWPEPSGTTTSMSPTAALTAAASTPVEPPTREDAKRSSQAATDSHPPPALKQQIAHAAAAESVKVMATGEPIHGAAAATSAANAPSTESTPASASDASRCRNCQKLLPELPWKEQTENKRAKLSLSKSKRRPTEQRFCSHECWETFNVLTGGGNMVRRRLLEMEHGVCQICKLDAQQLFTKVCILSLFLDDGPR